jgi:nitroimidazol reductase NimA-like FMN-containing flavoprotein (pyridoxamine 5'-phosphate oxidase superfamily)
MITQLAISQINDLVSDSKVGTLVCFDKNNKKKYPIAYVREGDYLYSYSSASEKIALMRNDPAVLLKIFQIKTDTGWSTANILGIYEELNGVEAEIAKCIIKDKIVASISSDHPMIKKDEDPKMIEEKLDNSDVIYRIFMIKKSGKAQTQN